MDLYRHKVDNNLSVVVEDDHSITLETFYHPPGSRIEVSDVHALVEALIHAKIERDHHDDEHAFFGDNAEYDYPLPNGDDGQVGLRPVI